MVSDYFLEMNNITKEFPGVKALNNVSLKIKPGSVHALMGENGAGKSTLMKCLFGIYRQDNGEIIINDEVMKINCPQDAMNNGISMIHQELLAVPFRNVMENIWLGRFPTKFGGLFIDHAKMYVDTKRLLEKLNLDIKPTTLIKDMSSSKVQLMEIARAVSYKAKVIIMDEPTSSLTEDEVEHLFKIIRKLKKDGVSIIYISHKIEEILEISDEVTIMRDGCKIGTWNASELTDDLIISNMVGRELTNRFPPRNNIPGEVVLETKKLSSPNPRSFQDISFKLRKGEILGIGGLVGAQRTELVEAMFGLRLIESGEIYLKGKKITIKSPIQAKKYKMALLTEERRSNGIYPVLNILENDVVANQKNYVNKALLIKEKKRIDDTNRSIKKLDIKTPSRKTLIKDLSGGNQQKVLIARWLLTEPEILLLDEPTRGIDVGAKYEIYNIIADLAEQGKSVIMISSEMPELLGMCDRIMVMCEGKLTGVIDGEKATQEEIMRLATQYSA